MKTALWNPDPARVAACALTNFQHNVNERYGLRLASYADLHRWSVEHLPEFWAQVREFTGMRFSHSYTSVLENANGALPGARWFPGARLNFAENILRYRDERTALIFYGEDQVRRTLSYRELYASVAGMQSALRDLGIVPGDRVVGFLPNMPEAVIAMLAATSLGAVWSSCSPDFGLQGVLDRFGQIRPRVLFTADGYFFKGKAIDSLERVAQICAQLPDLEAVVVIPYVDESHDLSAIPGAVHVDDFTDSAAMLAALGGAQIPFEQLPFDHPVYIMYSSGTTGLPKCMVQGPGVLLNHLKEHIIHGDLKRDDTLFYFTTTGWMMWNWLVSGLAVGATIVLFDGSPFHPDAGALWRMAAAEGVNIFGTSARYLMALRDANARPGADCDLSKLGVVLSTGSPLPPEGFEYVYSAIKNDVRLASISGGTDLNGCFALGAPTLPVYSGEIQCPGLGMDVAIFDETGQAVREQRGELVCRQAFPSMPLYFWDDASGQKYRDAYFDVYPGVWRHGDYAEITAQGGLIVYGRSDATLNPGGVRIGTADLYRIVEGFAEVEDSVVVGQDWQNDVRVLLFLKMKSGLSLTNDLADRIRLKIRDEVSPRHIPAKIIAVADIPYTLNMKKVELAVRKVIMGEPVLNRDALLNPDSLRNFENLAELRT